MLSLFFLSFLVNIWGHSLFAKRGMLLYRRRSQIGVNCSREYFLLVLYWRSTIHSYIQTLIEISQLPGPYEFWWIPKDLTQMVHNGGDIWNMTNFCPKIMNELSLWHRVASNWSADISIMQIFFAVDSMYSSLLFCKENRQVSTFHCIWYKASASPRFQERQ